MRCEQWFEEHEGRMVEVGSSGLAGAIRAAAGDTKFRFVCAGCETRGERRFAKVIVVLLILIALAWAWGERG